MQYQSRIETRRYLALALALVMAVAAFGVGALAPPPAVAASFDWLAGADRYHTAAATSAAFYGSGVGVVYIARGDDYPDALTAGPAAAREGGPVLIVRGTAIPQPVAAELERLAPQRIVVVGGFGVVSDSVEQQLDAYHTGGGVTRLAGSDRYATAAQVSAATSDPGDVVYIATGEAFPDALTGGAAAGREDAPVLLVRSDSVPDATAAELERLAPSRIVIVGGPGAVSNAVASELGAYTTGSVARLGGDDRYETANIIAREFGASDRLFLATSLNFPDAISAIAPAAQNQAPIVLTQGTRVPMRSNVEATVADIGPGIVHVMGGTGVVRDSVIHEVSAALTGVPPLPACEYEDIITPLTSTLDWAATLLDTRLRLPADYVPPDLVSAANAGLSGEEQVRSLIVPDLAAMVNAAAANGTPIATVSAYRSYQQQEATFNSWVDQVGFEQALRVAARPGHSEHQLGTTLDFTSHGGAPPWEFADWAQTPAGAWMAANAWRYGFVMSYPEGAFEVVCYDYEPWHYRYVGRTAAAEIRASGLTLREWQWERGFGVHP